MPEVAPAGASDSLLQGTLQLIGRERGFRAWLRSRSARGRAALGLAGMLLSCALQLLLAPRADLSVYPAARMGLACGVLAGGVRALLRIHLRPVSMPPLPGSVPPTVAGVFVAIGVLFAAAPAAHVAHAASVTGSGSDFLARASACLAYGLAVSAPFATLCWALDRDDSPAFRALIVPGAASALTANLLLQLHCPITGPGHLLAGHATVALGWGLVHAAIALTFRRAGG